MPYVADNTREMDDITKLCLVNEAFSQHFHQKKADANLCEFEVESTVAQYDEVDFNNADDEKEQDAWQLRDESADCLVLYEDGLMSEAATHGSTIADLEDCDPIHLAN